MPTDGGNLLPADLQVALLGPPRVLFHGRSITLPRRQTRALLYYLASAPSPVPRGRLCALFWPDLPESEARRNLTHLLTILRRTLPASTRIISGPEDVTLDPVRVWSDVRAFTRLTSAGAPAWRTGALRKALDLWRGPFLEGFDAGGSDVFEEWVTQRRAWWEHRYLGALASAMDAEVVAGAFAAAIALALDLRQVLGRPLLDVIKHALGERHLLLVLDNIEHLLLAAPLVSDLLASAPCLTVLATSRVLLRLAGEHAITVSHLGVPDLAALPPPERLAENAAVALFLARAQAHDADFPSRRPTPWILPLSAPVSTGSRWRWSWQPRACGC